MHRVKVRWAGFIGSPGWSNFYFDTGNEDFLTPEQAVESADKVTTFINAIRSRFPAAFTWSVQSDVEVISPQSGELLNVASAGARTPILGGAPAAGYSGTSGIVVTWRTAGVRNGRRVRGRTFLVPAANSVYQDDGTLIPTVLTDFTTAANALASQTGTGPKLGVWARPSAVGATDGGFHPVTAVSIPDMPAVLRSRRG